MGVRLILASALLLSGCDPAAVNARDGAAPDAANATMQAEAKRVCRQVTGYAPDVMSGKSPETVALFKRDFNACVASVIRGDAPALRGRVEAPPG